MSHTSTPGVVLAGTGAYMAGPSVLIALVLIVGGLFLYRLGRIRPKRDH